MHIKIFIGPSTSCYQGNCFESFCISWNDITQEVAIPEVTDRIFLKLSSYFYRCSTYFTISHLREVNRFFIVLPLFKPITDSGTYRLIFNHPGFLFGLSSPTWRNYCNNWTRAIFKPASRFLRQGKKDAGKKTIRGLFAVSGILKFLGDESSKRI